MKKLKKQLLTAGVTLMVCLTGACMSGCKDKNAIVYTLNTNGGVAIENVEVNAGEEYTLPTPTREGYAFEGWYTNAEFTGEPVTTVVATESATYYAKWATLYTITLDLNGGTLSATTLKLKEGENVSQFMASYVPTKEGFVFGAWFVGNTSTALTANTTMAGDMLLTAKYKVGYTVEIYKQNLDLNGYAEPEITVAYEYPGTDFVSEPIITGFKEVQNDNTVFQKVLSDNTAENVFKHYFNRESYKVTFNSNYPNGGVEKSVSQTVLYEEEITIPEDFTVEGYCLLGWSTSASGDVVFAVNYIQNSLFNGDDETGEEEVEPYYPTRDTDFYAVWKKGYIDMFAGGDYLYRLDEESEDIYLSRGGVYFKGTYDAEENEFEFRGDDFFLIGRLNDDGSFFYEDLERSEISCTLLEVGVGLIDTTTIYFDAYNGIQYSVKGEDGKTDVSKGTYSIDEEDCYVATFTEGPLSGKKLTLVVGYVNLGGNVVTAFQLRNDEEYEMGELISYVVVDGRLNYYQNSVYSIKLSGFGTASYNGDSGVEGYYYTREGDILTLVDLQGKTFGVYRLIESNGQKGYIAYDETMDQTFTLESGDTLTLDGSYNATYVKSGTTFTGLYTIKDSLIGKALVTMYAGSEKYIFHVYTETSEVAVEGGEEGETTTVTEYVAEAQLSTYQEFYYRDAQGMYYAPMLVLDAPAKDQAILYGYTTNRTHEEVSRGTYTYNEATGLYTYTADLDSLTYNKDVIDQPLDITNILEIEFAVINQEPFYSSFYWYSIKTVEDVETELEKTYTCEGDGDLTLVGGIAFYNGNTGTYSVAGKDTAYPGLVAVSVAGSVFYVELDEENNTYLKLDHAPYTAGVWVNGAASKTETFSLDGKGGATYSVKTEKKDTDGKNIKIQYVGTYEKMNETTPFGYYVFKFTGTDGTETKEFEFIQFAGTSAAFIALRDDVYTGEYRSEDGILVLDGFGYWASFTDAESGEKYETAYSVDDENVILMSFEDAYFYFDIQDNAAKTFTLRGAESGTYILVNNQSLSEGFVVLDGYGKLTVFGLEDSDDENGYEGTYEVFEDEIILYYTREGKSSELHGALSYMEYGGSYYYTFVVEYETFAMSFVNEDDWSVLELNGYGDAIKYKQNGRYEYGSYTVVTNDLFYYENQAGTDGALYQYDMASGMAKPVSLNPKGYYTEDLQSLRFTRWGYAVFNGSELYYYDIEDSEDGNGKVVALYKQDLSSDKANKYGFVREEFGTFEDTVTWEGTTYYINDGFVLTFSRAEDNTGYPLQLDDFVAPGLPIKKLMFTPGGDTEFSVTGKVAFDDSGKTYDCLVTREYNEDGQLEMYLTVDYYRVDITVTYNGIDLSGASNSFAVTRLRRVASYMSYMYMDMYYMIYSMLGSSMANTFPNQYGMIAFTEEINSTGILSNQTMSGSFGTFSDMYDTTGEVLGFEEEAYQHGWDYSFGADIYHVTFTGADNYVYHMYLTLQMHQAFGLNGYTVIAVTREEVITTGNYQLTVQKVLTSDYSDYKEGTPFKVVLMEGETKLYEGKVEMLGENTYCIVREKDENKHITATTYYQLTLVDQVSADMEESVVVDLYDLEKSSVVAKTVKTYYNSTYGSYFDVIAPEGENVPMMFVIGGGIVEIVAEYAYDAATKTYTMTMVSGLRYSITVGEDGFITWGTITDEVPSEETEE